MSKFKFRLATLLRLREQTRDERRLELAAAYRVDDVLNRQLQRMEMELGRLWSECRKTAGPGEVNVDRLVEMQRYELTVKVQQSQVIRQREGVRAEIERRHQTLLEANREVRVLENLRDKQAAQHRQDEDYRERKRLDEVAQQQAIREVVR
jgi:flagellar export protein FliJ